MSRVKAFPIEALLYTRIEATDMSMMREELPIRRT